MTLYLQVFFDYILNSFSSVTFKFAWNQVNIKDLGLDKLHIIIDAGDACNFIKQVSFDFSLEHADEIKKKKITK